MISYCIYKFWLNEDTTTIVFNRFNGSGIDIYPTISVCFKGKGFFDTEKIRNETNSEVEFKKFLEGKIWDDKLANVGYDNVTLKAEEMIQQFHIKSSNGSNLVKIFEWRYLKTSSKGDKVDNFPFKVSLRSPKAKCYSFDVNVGNVPGLKKFDVALIEMKIEKNDKRCILILT